MNENFKGFNRQQEAMNAIAQGWKGPFEELDRQQSALAEMVKGWKGSFEELDRQQAAIQKTMSSLESTFKVPSFDFDESLLALNDVIANTYTDIETKEKSNSTQFEQELSSWLNEQVKNVFGLIHSLRNMRNVVDTKSAVGYTITLINLVGAIITIVGFLQEGNTEIHIHDEDLIIESETDGNKTDIYIEKKESLPKPQTDNDDEKYSGGERT